MEQPQATNWRREIQYESVCGLASRENMIYSGVFSYVEQTDREAHEDVPWQKSK